MADFICRTLRDGGLEGEQSPALSINDTIDCPLGGFVFDYVLSQLSSFISSQKFPANGIVLVALARSPLYYENLLKRRGFDIAGSRTWFRVLDCYTDPLSWKTKLAAIGAIKNLPLETAISAKVCYDVKDSDGLFSSILELGRETGIKGSSVVAIDSVSDMLRHASVTSVSSLVGELRMHERICSVFWLAHTDLLETKAVSAVEYVSSMKAAVVPPIERDSSTRGRLCVRIKRRNGRVKAMVEDVFMEDSAVVFRPVSSDDVVTAQKLVPKVHFNLGLSEEERSERAKVILPFEHQGGNGKAIDIYDGRKAANGGGEIVYLRDSDDEMPDSDEDPDDDLDI